MSSIMEKAKDLGNALARTDEYQALRRAMDSVDDDRELVELRNRIEQLETTLEADIRAGRQPSEEIRTEYAEVAEELQRRPAFQRVISAQANFEKIMHKVNETVAQGIEEGAKSRIILS
ncbi:MAG TPA: YlbF family regulator [Longimicrobiales bacterium]|nr:YlbF family regulator [Longimicrobiales bacterium]